YNYAHRIDGDGVWGGTWAVLAWLRETVVSWEDLEQVPHRGGCGLVPGDRATCPHHARAAECAAMSRRRFASLALKSTSTSVGCVVGGAAAGTVASSAVKAPSKAAAAATFAVADAAAATLAAGFLRGLPLFGRWRFARWTRSSIDLRACVCLLLISSNAWRPRPASASTK
ncbi:unnamed protein product, partial [Pelagomonas calceolata]